MAPSTPLGSGHGDTRFESKHIHLRNSCLGGILTDARSEVRQSAYMYLWDSVLSSSSWNEWPLGHMCQGNIWEWVLDLRVWNCGDFFIGLVRLVMPLR